MTAIKTKAVGGRSLSNARSNFVSAVSNGVIELMGQCGYSRERATSILLRELRRDGETPTDNEIFHMMQCQSIGSVEAEKALTVSKAVRKIMKERGKSAVEAIDDLTSRLSLSNLLLSDRTPEKPQPTRKSTPIKRQQPALKMTHTAQRKPPMSAKKIMKQKLLKPKLEGKSIKLEAKLNAKVSRKRSQSEEKEAAVAKIGRQRSDSISTEQVKAKMAQSDSSGESSRTPARGKRSHLDGQVSQPNSKRTRSEV